ncbi:MAG: ATP-binding protein [Sphingomonadales bacterium]
MGLKAAIRRHWPRLRLRTILFGTLLFTAALPLVGAVFFRIYENTLVRQTESELIVQGAVMAAAFGDAISPRPAAGPGAPDEPEVFRPMQSQVSLSDVAILPDRPGPRPAGHAADPRAAAAATRIAPILFEATRTTLAGVRLLDRNGIVVAGRDETGLSLAHVPEVAAALVGRPSSSLRRKGGYEQRYPLEWLSRASAIRVFHAQPVYANGNVAGAVLLSRSPRSLFRGLYDDLDKLLLAGGLILAIVVGIAGLLGRSITRPVEHLAGAMGKVASGQRSVPETPATAAVEIRTLFDNFRDMEQRIDDRSTYIRDFAAAVSHEFKTPLTAIRGAIELLTEHGAEMDGAERARFLANIAADADRLNLLVSRLLELARADMLESGPAESCRPLHIARALGVSATGEDAEAAIPADALESILAGLIGNSRQHGAAATVAVRGGERVTVDVADDGPGIPVEDRARIFEPFFTTRRSHGGTGLGLPIARSLLRAYGGTLELVPSERGALFRLTLLSSVPPAE